MDDLQNSKEKDKVTGPSPLARHVQGRNNDERDEEKNDIENRGSGCICNSIICCFRDSRDGCHVNSH
jgi:hypothetical protein